LILVDTSIWIDHLRSGNTLLQALLQNSQVLSHPFVIGELALGQIKQRKTVLHDLRLLPQATISQDDEVLHFISRHSLFGLGIGYIDAHLLASVLLTPGTQLWTRDKRLLTVAETLSLSFTPRP
jgi:predicted nucleic acid-binding protein